MNSKGVVLRHVLLPVKASVDLAQIVLPYGVSDVVDNLLRRCFSASDLGLISILRIATMNQKSSVIHVRQFVQWALMSDNSFF